MRVVPVLLLALNLNCLALFGQTTNGSVPGAPGNDAHWPTAAKVGFGTSNTLQSKVWFTLAQGVMTEVYYPRLDVPNTQCLQLVVCTRAGCETEQDDMVHEVTVPNPRALLFQQNNSSRRSGFKITKTYVTDPERPTVLIQVAIEGLTDQTASIFVYYDPSLNNSGMHDSAWSRANSLFASDKNVASALILSSGFSRLTNGFLGVNDGLQQLKTAGRITNAYVRADNGNVVQLGQLSANHRFTIALGFGGTSNEALLNARASIRKGFNSASQEYQTAWSTYLKSLKSVESKYERQFNIAAMVLKGLEDKTYQGAAIASPSIPWGGGPNANEPTGSGYHAIWARDLYHTATAFLAMGDKISANRALDYLFKTQQKPDGSFPQNSWLDGRAIGSGLQMDQVAFPIVLAYQLNRADKQSWLRHIKPAAEFLVVHGPSTGQDRWEEESGYSPATIAAEIAGLVCAAHIAEINGDKISAGKYLIQADEWRGNVERWTATTNGPHGDGNYFLRISEQGKPNDGAKIEINSGGGTCDQREIVDAGFLELVRLGVKSPDDPLILKSISVVDKLIKAETPAGPAWFRYNRDAYGERVDGEPYDGQNGMGRLWTLLTGERAEFELSRGNVGEARRLLDTLAAFANEGLMIPEQVWDGRGSAAEKTGTGTGSATPLAWSMAQFIRLVINIQHNRNLETPDVVAARYRWATAFHLSDQ